MQPRWYDFTSTLMPKWLISMEAREGTAQRKVADMLKSAFY
jgi:hypothetical protein